MRWLQFRNYLLMLILVYLGSCNSRNGPDQQPAAKAAIDAYPDTVKSKIQMWDALEQLANSFEDKAIKKANVPIPPNIARTYMASYKRNHWASKRDSALGVILSRESLAFYIKYLLEHPDQDIVASYGIYDADLLQSRSLRHDSLDRNPEYKNQHGLIMGIKSAPFVENGDTFYCAPFMIDGGATAVYDDWHTGWPPPTKPPGGR